MTLTVDDRELGYWGPDADGDWIVDVLGAGLTFAVVDEQKARAIADRLQSLLSDRDKLEQLLERVWACRADVGQGRFINLEKLWPVIDDIGVALTQTEVP